MPFLHAAGVWIPDPQPRRVARVPSSDARQPTYRWALLNVERTDWIASTENETEGLPAFRRLIELGEASEIVEVRP